MKNQSTNHADMFNGFVLSSEQEFAMPTVWREISKEIGNLAEYKIVELIIWITWGNDQPDAMVPLTIDDIMECTGLSRQSVRTGIEKAMQHGYIERQIQDCIEEGNIYKVRYYGLKLYQEQDKDLVFDEMDEIGYNQDLDVVQDVSFSDETALEADFYQEQNVSCSSNEFERYPHNNNYEDVSRIQEANIADCDQSVEPSPRKTKMGKYPAFLCSHIEQFSQVLGDFEHTASNIGQAHHIYLDYIAKGGNPKAFIELMKQAREITQKKSGIKRKNSHDKRNAMPYFFACLKRACVKSKDQIAA